MKENVEKIIIFSLLDIPEYFNKTNLFIQEEYFKNKDTKLVFKLLKSYIRDYDEVPSRTELRTMLSEVDVEEDFRDECLEVINFEPEDEINLDWVLETSEEYCRERATHLALIESLDIIEGKNKKLKASVVPEILERAINLKFDNDIGIEFFDEIERKIEKYDENVTKIVARLSMLNKITNGGWERKTVNCVAAPTGFGKSIWLGDEAIFQAKQGYNVAYITFEMSDSRIEARLEANALDETMSALKSSNTSELRERFNKLRGKKHGFLVIKEYGPEEITAQHLSAYLREVKMTRGEAVDILVVDYLNLMASAKYGNGVGTYQVLKGICNELVALAKKHNIVILTATQFNRGGQATTSPEIKDISESQAIANTVDFLGGMYDTAELEKANKLVFRQLKNRYGDKGYYRSFLVGINRSKMSFYDLEESESINLADNDIPEALDENSFKKKKPVSNEKTLFDKTDFGSRGSYNFSDLELT